MLVVDDDTDSATSLALLLSHDGHLVRTAGSGAAALELAVAMRPELALLDLGLGDMTGYDLARAIRRLPGSAPIIVALTGHDGAEVLRRCREAGFDAHLVKPILEFERLRTFVRTLEVAPEDRL